MKFVPLVLYVLSWVFAWVAKNHYQFFTEALFLSVLLLAVGVRELIAFVGNRFQADKAAHEVGRTASGFQKDFASANLGLGVAGMLSYFQPIFSFGTALFATIFFLGLGVTRIKELKTNSDLNLKKMLPIIAADFLIPLTLLYSFWHMHHITKIL